MFNLSLRHFRYDEVGVGTLARGTLLVGVSSVDRDVLFIPRHDALVLEVPVLLTCG